jgi:hypothetical protein
MLLIKTDLSPLDGNLVWGIDPDPYRVVVDLHDRDPNAFPDVKTLAKLPAQYQHDSLLLESRTRRPGIVALEPSIDRTMLMHLVCQAVHLARSYV